MKQFQGIWKESQDSCCSKNNGMYIAVAYNKATGNPVNKKETTRFYDMVDDIKKGDHGTMLTDAIYGSSVGFRGDALVELEKT